MGVQITIRLSAGEFDKLRRAIKFAGEHADRLWRDAKEQGQLAKEYHDLYRLVATCEHLLEHTLA